jgi:hypothetical protein
MALSRATMLLLMLPCPAIVLLSASLEDVNASQCLSSAEAVRREYPSAWPSWTMQAANHKGVKCWYPAMRESRARHIDVSPHKDTSERRRIEPGVKDKTLDDDNQAAAAGELNVLGWNFRSRTTRIGPAIMFEEGALVESSFEDRFSAAFEVTSVSQPSVIQRMMDPGGAIP